MKAILSKHLVALFMIAAAFLTATAVICYHAVGVIHRNQRWVSHTHQVMELVETVRGALSAAEANQRNYLFTGDEQYVTAYADGAARAAETTEVVAGLTQDNESQQRRVQDLRVAVSERVGLLNEGLSEYRAGREEAARKLIASGAGKRAMNHALAVVREMEDEEQRLLMVRSAESSTGLRRLAITFALVGLMNVALLGVIVLSVRREIAERAEAARDLKASEGRLLLAVEAAQLGFWEHDLVTHRFVASDRCRDIFGIPRDQPITGETFLARIHPEDRDHLQAVVRKSIEPGGRGEFMIEYRVVDPGGETRIIRSRGRALFEGAGPTRRALRLVGTLLDLTDFYLVERELREARDRAEAASRAKDQFLAVLSHELRTPLTPVLASVSELEQRSDVPEHLRSDIGTIRRNIEMEARLIDDLLDLTRIARGKVRLHPEVIDVHGLVRAVLDMFRPEAAEKDLAVEADLSAPRHHVWGDPGRLQQVLWNLLSNAVKFTPRGGRVTVRTIGAGGDDGRITIEVSDTGIGIDPAAVPRLFNAFEQGEQTIARRYGGLGLGLSIAKAIVDLHEGTIEAQSPGRDRGTRFIVRLKTAPAPKPPAPEAEPAAPSATLPAPAKLRILLVEDNEDTRRLMGRLLRTFGHHVDAADSVATALDLAGREHFDLLVSDIGLPDGTGWELMGKLGERRPPKAIALSGFGMEDDLRRSREAGFLEHITKPVNIVALRQTIDRIAGQESPN